MAVSGDFRWPRLGILNGRLRGVSDGHYQLTGARTTTPRGLVLAGHASSSGR